MAHGGEVSVSWVRGFAWHPPRVGTLRAGSGRGRGVGWEEAVEGEGSGGREIGGNEERVGVDVFISVCAH